MPWAPLPPVRLEPAVSPFPESAAFSRGLGFSVLLPLRLCLLLGRVRGQGIRAGTHSMRTTGERSHAHFSFICPSPPTSGPGLYGAHSGLPPASPHASLWPQPGFRSPPCVRFGSFLQVPGNRFRAAVPTRCRK